MDNRKHVRQYLFLLFQIEFLGSDEVCLRRILLKKPDCVIWHDIDVIICQIWPSVPLPFSDFVTSNLLEYWQTVNRCFRGLVSDSYLEGYNSESKWTSLRTPQMADVLKFAYSSEFLIPSSLFILLLLYTLLRTHFKDLENSDSNWMRSAVQDKKNEFSEWNFPSF